MRAVVLASKWSGLNWDESRQSTGRRSRLEMVCDTLRVISQGIEKPTRIMQLSNLTWKDLLMYLEVMVRNQLITRELQGGRVGYKLTSKGEIILDLYLKLRQESAPLRLESLSTERVSEAMKMGAGAADEGLAAVLAKRLQESGFVLGDNRVVGKSGETHIFGLVATAKDGSKHGYAIMDEIREEHVLGLFVNHLDTDMYIHAYSKNGLSPATKSLADTYSISVEQWEGETKGRRQAARNVLSFKGRSLLLEVDPSANYERVVKDFATQYRQQSCSVLVFTWRGSPVYEALSGMEGTKFYVMTTSVSYARQGSKPNEVLVPQNDQAVILDEVSKVIKEEIRNPKLILFDSISDIIVTFGFERSYEFMKNVNELVNERAVTSVFILKAGAHDERATSLVRGLYRAHATYGVSGLNVTREA